MDDLKRRSTAGLSKAELDKLQGDKKDKEVDKDGVDSTRITRLKAQQIATGIIMSCPVHIMSCPVQMNIAFKFISSCLNKEEVVNQWIRGYRSSFVEDTSLLGCWTMLTGQ